MREGVQVALHVPRHVRSLGEVLAQQSVSVFIDAALPRFVGIGKEDVDREPPGQLLVSSPLFASIIGQGFAHTATARSPRVCPV